MISSERPAPATTSPWRSASETAWGGEDEFSSLLLAAGCDPAYVMAQVGTPTRR